MARGALSGLYRGVKAVAGIVAVVGLGTILFVHPSAITAAPANDPSARTTGSGLPVPRFVSLKSSKVNVRVGPGEDYGVSWVFVKPGLPIEVIQEFDNWRRIRDSDGQVGWVFQSLLSGKRTAVVAPWQGGEPRPIRASDIADARITAYLEPGVVGDIERCRGGWCEISGKGYSGWIARDQLWGVYPDEDIN
ncbi:MAG: SH3 domain-containing protein [Bauldia sp.]|nr:SH3 domain-containing protein [Bauldia sp.]